MSDVLVRSAKTTLITHEGGPSIMYGFHRHDCSTTWKRDVMDLYVEGRRAKGARPAKAGWGPALAAWERGVKVTRLIGYDAGKQDSRRAWKLTDDDRYRYVYPLRLWGWTRERCVEVIQEAGLPVPQKSACFFCPAMQPEELELLAQRHPHLAKRVEDLETAMAEKLTKAEGLWFKSDKRRPGSMTVHLRTLKEGAVE